VFHRGLGARAEVDREELHEPLTGGRVAGQAGHVAVQPAADVGDLDPDAERHEHRGDQCLERGHAHRGDRLEHALHVAELEVDPRLVAGRRRREERGDRAGLQQPQRAVPVDRPFDVLRAAEMLLQPGAHRLQFGENGRRDAAAAGPVVPGKHVVVDRRSTVHHGGAQPRGRVDQHRGAAAGDRIGGEQHTRGGGVDHPLHDHTHPHRPVVALRTAVGNGALAVGRPPAPLDGRQHRIGAADPELRRHLPGVAGVRRVLDGGTRPHRHRSATQPLVGRRDQGGPLLSQLHVGRHGEPRRHPQPQLDHLAQPGCLAPDDVHHPGGLSQRDHPHRTLPTFCNTTALQRP
jgi:hypothetical protein